MTTLDTPTSVWEGEIFKVIVRNGIEAETAEFHLHKQLLSNLSPYFRALPNFSEGKHNSVEFDEMSPRAFRYVVMWMYNKDLPQLNEVETGDLLIQAWTIADRLMMSECKNAIMRQIQEHFRGRFVRKSHLLQVEMLNLSSTQALPRFLKDQFAYESRSDQVQCQALTKDISSLVDRSTDYSTSIILSVVSELKSALKGGYNNYNGQISPALNADGTYHEHLADDVCGSPACSKVLPEVDRTTELSVWDHGLNPKERRKKEKEMKANGSWDMRITEEMIDEGVAADRGLAN